MKSALCLSLLFFFFSFVFADPYWLSTIPNGIPGNPAVREFQSLTNIPGTGYNILFGGVTYNNTFQNVGDTWLLDINSLSWKLLEPASYPPARAYHVAGSTSDGKIIIFGGMNEAVPRVFFSDVWRYDMTGNSWTQDQYNVPSPLIARGFASGLVVSDTLYIFGGFVQTLQAVTNDLCIYLTSKQWALRSSNGKAGSPPPRQGHSATFYNDPLLGPSILFFGGYTGTGGMSDTWQFVISTSSWVQLTKTEDPSGPSPRWGHSAFLGSSSSSSLVIFGGSFVGGPINPYYNDVWTLNINGISSFWNNTIPDGDEEGPWKRGGHSSVIANGRSFTFGGYGLFVGLYNDLWELVGF